MAGMSITKVFDMNDVFSCLLTIGIPQYLNSSHENLRNEQI